MLLLSATFLQQLAKEYCVITANVFHPQLLDQLKLIIVLLKFKNDFNFLKQIIQSCSAVYAVGAIGVLAELTDFGWFFFWK
jgi:hypothetical protein